LEVDFDEVFRWFILIDLKRLEGEVRGLVRKTRCTELRI